VNSRTGLFVVIAALFGAGAFAVIRPAHPDAPPASAVVADPSPSTSPALPALPGFNEPMGDVLPPNHPPIGGTAAPGSGAPAATEDAAITWTVPAEWVVAANPSTMRLATYHVKSATPGADDADLSVVRAGGTADANIDRWVGQFDDAGQDTRTTQVVRGLKVTIVEVAGTFTGGSMMPGAPSTPRKGWALLGAIVETPGSPYFFKLTGDAKTVHAARGAFASLIKSIKPS
jgi:hypothetical protein